LLLPFARKIRFCGYLDIEPLVVRKDIRHTLGIADEPLVLVTIGHRHDSDSRS
jgi:hypothetical protein